VAYQPNGPESKKRFLQRTLRDLRQEQSAVSQYINSEITGMITEVKFKVVEQIRNGDLERARQQEPSWEFSTALPEEQPDSNKND